MSNTVPITYSIAVHSEEMKQIYALNYATFVEEIPQHEINDTGQLIDRFHDENTYIIAKHNDVVIGMIAVRGQRPFSLDQKLDDLDIYLPVDSTPCEVRLLSIKKPYRGSRVFYGLCERLVSYCLDQGYSTAIISGTTRQLKLYRHIGFKPFGPLVGKEEARYQPMYLTKENFEKSSKISQRLISREEKSLNQNFLPGPVPVNPQVEKAWNAAPISHRDAFFMQAITAVRTRLCQLTNANFAEVAVGTGTLANEMIAAQLTRLPGKGIILVNGEFGERLVEQALRWNLSIYELRKEWNKPIRAAEVDVYLKDHTDIEWVWTVHCETSTGYVYPLDELKKICGQYSVKLCVDACSSIGVFPVNLSGTYLASTVSGKGLASYPGIAIVLHEDVINPDETLPAYLDLGIYQQSGSVPFTHSSNGLLALQAALNNHSYAKQELSQWVRNVFISSGMTVLGGDEYSAGIVTVRMPEFISAKDFGDQLKSRGIRISYESNYLLDRNWVQVALMGNQKEANVKRAVNLFVEQYKSMAKGTVLS